jgi:hypothetical protein
MNDRRERIQALVLALLASQGDLGLLEGEHGGGIGAGAGEISSGWLERNRRLVQRYQAVVRTAVTLDALIEQEMASDQLAGP